jgi:peptide/nickel transport system substrate-binding protein
MPVNDRSAIGGGARIGRRGLLQRGIGAAGLAAATAAACGGGKKNSSGPGHPTESTAPTRGGSLTLSVDFQQKFDPHTASVSQTSGYGMFYQNLVRYNPKTFDIEPELAQRWESPSPTELVFTLAPEVRWHDKPPANGRALTVDDVVFSFKRMQTDDPRFIYRSSLAGVERIEAVDSRTVRFTFKEPNAYQLGNLAVAGLKIMAPEVVEAVRDNFASAESVVGTGAFAIQAYEQNVGGSFVRHPAYYKPGLPYLDRIDTRVFADEQTEYGAFAAGKIDKVNVPGGAAATVESQKKDQYHLEWTGEITLQLQMANVRRKPFDDPRVTRALRLLSDHGESRSAWAGTWYGRGRLTSIFPAALEAWDLTEDEYAQQLEWKQPKDDAIREALTLLAAAGFSKANPLKFSIAGVMADFQDAARQLVQGQFKRNGQGAVDPDLQGYQDAAFASVRAGGQFDYFVAGNSPGGLQPDDWFSGVYQTNASRNYGKASDPRLDAMFAKQRTIFDESERKQAIRQIILYMIENSPYTSQVGVYELNATKPDVHDFVPEGKSFRWGERYESIWR